MGLGSATQTSLAEAREKAAEARREFAAGKNPIEAREAARKAAEGRKTFGDCATALIAAKSHEWRNSKHRAQWRTTLETYAAPVWNMPVDEVYTSAVLSVLQPIWQAKPETASRLRGRIEAVLAFAKAHEEREGENPARWRGHLDKLLAKRQKLTRGHYAAMPYRDVTAFLASLQERDGIAAMALEFLVLTLARSGEVLGARWPEIDFEVKVWTVPGARMKTGRGHRVPLSSRALAILKRLAEAKTCEFVFPGQNPGAPLSIMALRMVLRRMKVEGATVHGFRSSFRDWCGEETSFPREVAEAALAHVAGDSTERAYRRGDALEKRRRLMEAWAHYVESGAGSNVVRLARNT